MKLILVPYRRAELHRNFDKDVIRLRSELPELQADTFRKIYVTSTRPQDGRAIKAVVAGFQTPSLSTSLWQIANSVLPLAATMVAMHYALTIPHWWGYGVVLALAVLAAGFVVRLFIIQHDCGHGSFFRSKAANDWTGFFCGIVTFTPYANWARQHAGHHATWNNLDRRHTGVDIYSTCVTLAEYEALTPRQQFLMRLTRMTPIYLVLIPPLVFLVLYRLPFDTPRAWVRERRSVHLNNAMLLGVFVAMGIPLGFVNVLLVQVPITAFAAIIGVFLFSIQHRFETTLWARREDWNALDASLQGSSFLKLGPVLRWFTGNIGYHHIHHLNSRVPNYRLQAAHEDLSLGTSIPVLTLGTALRNHENGLWDEAGGRMVSFAAAGQRAV